MADIACVGVIVADVVAKPVDNLPQRGSLRLIDAIELHIGGCAANSAVGISRLGLDVSLFGNVGTDAFGDAVANRLNREGVDTAGLSRDASLPTSCTVVLGHSDGERTFLHVVGANAGLTPETLDFDRLEQFRIVHLAGLFLLPGLDPGASIMRTLKTKGVITCADTAWDAQGRWLSLIRPLLPHLDYFLPSWEEAKMISGRSKPDDAARFLLDQGIGTVVIKQAEQGCWLADNEKIERLPAYKVEYRDALGAGDAFCAGFLSGLAKGLSARESTQLANAVGALCVTRLGATTGLIGWDETIEFMKRSETNP